MEKNAKIYIAGHRGLVGSAIWKNLQDKGYTNLIGRTHKELDLLDGMAVSKLFLPNPALRSVFLLSVLSSFFFIPHFFIVFLYLQ